MNDAAAAVGKYRLWHGASDDGYATVEWHPWRARPLRIRRSRAFEAAVTETLASADAADASRGTWLVDRLGRDLATALVAGAIGRILAAYRDRFGRPAPAYSHRTVFELAHHDDRHGRDTVAYCSADHACIEVQSRDLAGARVARLTPPDVLDARWSALLERTGLDWLRAPMASVARGAEVDDDAIVAMRRAATGRKPPRREQHPSWLLGSAGDLTVRLLPFLDASIDIASGRGVTEGGARADPRTALERFGTEIARDLPHLVPILDQLARGGLANLDALLAQLPAGLDQVEDF